MGLIIGFLTSFLPKGLDIFNRILDQKHEIEMRKLDMEMAEKDAGWRLDETNVRADSEALQSAYQFASKDVGYKWVEALIGLVRPGITFGFFGLYTAMKVSAFILAKSATGDWKYAMSTVWTVMDMETFQGIIGFWFGLRHQSKR